MPRQTQDSAGILPLVCYELLALAFAMVAGTDGAYDWHHHGQQAGRAEVVSAVPPGQEAVMVARPRRPRAPVAQRTHTVP